MNEPTDTSEESITASEPGGRASLRLADRLPETSALIGVLVVLMAFFTWRSPFFFTSTNLVNVLSNIAVLGLVAAPMTVLLIAGQFDLSVGSGVALVSVLFAYSLEQGWSTWSAVVLAIALGCAIGIANGFLVTVLNINALIATLGTLAIMRGLAQVRSEGQSIGIRGFDTIALDEFLGMPWAVWMLIGILILTAAFLRFTVAGRGIFAIGANPVAARLAGVPVRLLILGGFIASGLMIGVAGLVLSSQTGQGSGNSAIGLELSAVTAVVLGGASLAGGRGTILGTGLGLLILGIINNGLTLLNIQSFWQEVVRGCLLIAAVAFDQLRQRWSSA